MGIRCGLVGLPNVGKSTLFNALTCSNIAADNFPFCTIEPNTGMVGVPDSRLHQLAEIAQSKDIVASTLEFVDIAGLIAGAAEGEGLGNRFLSHIRDVDLIAHVVRCFEDKRITHVSDSIDPERDIGTINTELMLADLQSAEKQLDKIKRIVKGGDALAIKKMGLLQSAYETLDQGNMVRSMQLDEQERALLPELQFLTAKPIVYVANIADVETRLKGLDAVKEIANLESAPMVSLCIQLESELAELPVQEAREMLESLNMKETGLEQLTRQTYKLLGLRTFFTAGPKEAHAWPILHGLSAQQAAGTIHTDFERGFIRAEVIGFDDFIACGSEAGAKEAGKWRLEGKDYQVQDGDVMHFRFNI